MNKMLAPGGWAVKSGHSQGDIAKYSLAFVVGVVRTSNSVTARYLLLFSIEWEAEMFKFQAGEIVKAKSSGKLYSIVAQRTDGHPKLKGEIGYGVVGRRNGKSFGPYRLMREASLIPAQEERV